MAAVERIVVQATPQDKKAFVAKAKALDLPLSELMRRGACAYQSSETDAELASLASAAKKAADNAGCREIENGRGGCVARHRGGVAPVAREGRS